MSWAALVLTLLLEQARAVPPANPVYAGAEAWADRVARNCNAGKVRHGVYGWILVVGVATALTIAGFHLARWGGWIPALAVNVAVLFFTLGFRQFSHPITAIQRALQEGDLAEARRLFLQWRREVDPDFDPTEVDDTEIVRKSMEFGLLAAHRHVFGVLFWFLVLPGPSGAVLYRLSEFVARRWNRLPASADLDLPPDRFGAFARRAFAWIDWVPARLTALGFAIVGDFEGAAYCWREASVGGQPAWEADRVLILAAASGALGVRVLGGADSARMSRREGAESDWLVEPTPQALQSAVGLAWRAMILWLLLLLLVTVAATVA